MKHRSSRILFGVGSVIFIAGIILGISAKVPEWLGMRLSGVEFPFGDLVAVAADSGGRIYVADGWDSRVQRYGLTGNFELGWFVDVGGGTFTVRVTGNNDIKVDSAREGVLIYSPDGQLLDHRTSDGDYNASEISTGASQYQVERWPFPHVIDMHTGQTVLASPWPKRLVSAPFPAMAYATIGLAIAALGELRRRLEIRKEETEKGLGRNTAGE
jgi:hypothetical protein